MALWTLTSNGGLSSGGTDLDGPFTLTGAQPADWNPDAINSVRIRYTVNFSALGDDKVTDHRNGSLYNASGQRVATWSGGDIDRTTLANNDSGAIGAGGIFFPSATGNYLSSGIIAPMLTYVANMKNDGGSVSVSSITVDIDYTPLVPEAPTVSLSVDRTTDEMGDGTPNSTGPIFTATATGSPAPTLSWDFDGGYNDDAAVALPANQKQIRWTTAGVKTVTVTATNSQGSAQDSVQVTVNAPAVAVPEIWNGAEWVGGKSWNGTEWVVPEIWNGAEWLPLKAHGGVLSNDFSAFTNNSTPTTVDGGLGGSLFDLVIGSPVVSDTANVDPSSPQGLRCAVASANQTVAVGWNIPLTTSDYTHLYFRMPNPQSTVQPRILRARAGTTIRWEIRINDGYIVFAEGSGGTSQWQTTNRLTAGVVYRLEVHADIVAANTAMRVFSADGLTEQPVTYFGTADITNGWDNILFGHMSGGTPLTAYQAEIGGVAWDPDRWVVQ